MGQAPPSDPLTWQEFGAALLDTEDLDPVYVAVAGAGLDEDQLSRWLLAYWCFYSAATASDVSDAVSFWGAMLDEFDTKERGFERRHFRGDKARAAVRTIMEQGSPEEIVRWISGRENGRTPERIAYGVVADRVQRLPMFGPWIAWKAADMLERIAGVPVIFDPRALAMYKDPVQGAALLRRGNWRAPITDEEVAWVAGLVVREFRDRAAPPRYDRPFNVQEAETVLCKYKAYRKGSYRVGKDIKEMRKGLAQSEGPTAARVLSACPTEVT